MAPIAQPYSRDACGIGYGAFSALGWAESRFGIDLLVSFSPSSLSPSSSSLLMRRHLSCYAATSIVAPTPVSLRLSPTVAGCHFPLVAFVVVFTIMIVIVVVVVLLLLSHCCCRQDCHLCLCRRKHHCHRRHRCCRPRCRCRHRCHCRRRCCCWHRCYHSLSLLSLSSPSLSSVVSVIIVSLDAPPPLSSRRHLYCRVNACLIAPLSHSGWLSLSSCHHHCQCHHHDRHHRRHLVVIVVLLLLPS